MFDLIFKKTKEQILNNAPCIVDVLMYNEQDLDNQDLPFPTPCVFLSFENIEYDSMNASTLHCSYELVTRLAVEDLSKDSLTIFPVGNELDIALHNFGTEAWGGENLFMRNKVLDNSYDRLVLSESRYTGGFKMDMSINQKIKIEDWGYSVTGYSQNDQIAFQYDITKD